MTIKQAIRYVVNMEEPAFSDRMMLRWINLLEAEIQVKIHLLKPGQLKQYDQNQMEEILIAPPPFDKIYPEYLIWKIRQAQGEEERAQNQKEIYEKAWKAYTRFVCQQKEMAT